MKRGILLLCGCLVFCLGLVDIVEAMAEPSPAPKPEAAEEYFMEEGESGMARPGAPAGAFVISDFESGSLKSPVEWWAFDLTTAKIASNDGLKIGGEDILDEVGNYSLLLKGKASNWYAGGCGVYLAKEGEELSAYDTFQLDIYGNGEGSGTIKVELFDDDNNNWQVENDPAKAYAPIYDDRFEYNIEINWSGWQRVTIPLDDFVDNNPGIGDDVWNPQQQNGSGGLLQLQFICLAPKADGYVNYNIDNILLRVGE